MSLRKIAKEVGCAVNTVRSHLAADALPNYQRNKLRETKLSPFHDYLRERQDAARPEWIPATVLLREIVARGYTGFNGYLRRSFYVPLAAQLKQVGLALDAVTANIQVRIWLKEIANERIHGTTQIRPSQRLPEECLQPIPSPWRGDIRAARPQRGEAVTLMERPVVVVERIAQASPMQHPLAMYEQLLDQIRDAQEVSL